MPRENQSNLLDNDELMHFAIEAAPNGMVIVDDTGSIVLANSSVETLFGYDRNELLGQPIERLVPERFSQAHPGLRSSYLQAPEARAMGHGRDLYGLHKNGTEIPVEIGLNPIRIEDRVFTFATIVDITERKQQEESLKSALLAKETLLSEIHHRVKNNLQIIDSLIGMQMDQVAGEQARTALMESQNRVKTISLIHQILYQSQDFAQIDAGEFIASLTHNLVQSYGVDLSRIDLQLNVDPLFLSMNRSLPLGLIVNELVSNALKHAFPDDKTGTLTVSLRIIDDSTAVLAVSDTGIGLPPGTAAGESETLGLRLVEALASQIEAQLTVTASHPTRFELRFETTQDEADQIGG